MDVTAPPPRWGGVPGPGLASGLVGPRHRRAVYGSEPNAPGEAYGTSRKGHGADAAELPVEECNVARVDLARLEGRVERRRYYARPRLRGGGTALAADQLQLLKLLFRFEHRFAVEKLADLALKRSQDS